MSAGTDFHDDNSQESQIEDEHFVPEFGLDLDRYLNAGHIGGVHHLIRYLWALEVLKDAPHIHSLLDIACGSGYGSYLLAT